MTREDANFILANIDRRVCDAELSEALDMVTKALSAEPCRDIEEIREVISCDSDAETKCKMISNILTAKPHYFKQQEPCEDAISREDAIMALTGEWTESTDELIHRFIRRIRTLPPVTPKQKMGRWISFGPQGEIDGQIVRAFTCSECGAISIFRMTSGSIVNGDLCPNCGAKMESGDQK